MTKAEERIRFDTEGFWVERGGSPSARMAWERIQVVEAFKQDMLTFDLLCLEIAFGDTSIVVHEELLGWKEFVNQLPAMLVGIPPFQQWFATVAFPAFAENRLKLFARES